MHCYHGLRALNGIRYVLLACLSNDISVNKWADLSICSLCLSENSLDPCSPSRPVTADVCTPPGSVVTEPEPEDTTSKNITAPEPKAPNTDQAFPGSAKHMPQQEPSDSCPTDHPEDRSPLESASASPYHSGNSDANVDAVMSLEPSAATFWARCNEAGSTEEIFSELVSQLYSLRERIQSREATQQGERAASVKIC